MKFMVLVLVVCLGVSISHAQYPHDDYHTVRTALHGAGLTAPINTINPSGIGELLVMTLGGVQEPLLITPQADYIIQGNIENNPSPIVPIDKALQTTRSTGTPVTDEYKQALLANTKQLKNMTADTAFYHTSIQGLLWGVSGQGGTPFLMSADGRKFINGDVSRIEDGRFVGLDTAFEWAKNRHVLSSLDENTLAVYPANRQKAVVYIATDIHCPYCKIFHAKIGQFNRQGITVKAIGYPVYDNSHQAMQQIWCQKDNTKRAVLLTAAMKGILPKTTTCDGTKSPIISTQKCAQPLAVMATPSIYREDGVLFEGDFTTDEFLVFLGIK